MRKISLQAHAKINYALDVLSVRDDGYHEISTVFQSISLHDEVEIERGGEGFELVVEPVATRTGPPENNTVRTAWKLLRSVTGEDLPAKITLRKRIPPGAGLGGASADAAAALIGLDELFCLGLDDQQLREIGARIGADVPFCMKGGTALGEGVGEVLTTLRTPPEHHLVLAKPPFGAETAGIYRLYDECPRHYPASAGPVAEALRAEDLPALAGAVGNMLAPVTKETTPEVERLERDLLRAGALGAAMTGSGTAVYGLFASRDEASAARRKLSANFAEVCEPVGHGVENL